MARLIVDACPSEWNLGGDAAFVLQFAASVSWAETGGPVTGLTQKNFIVAAFHAPTFYDYVVAPPRELKLEPGDVAPSGCYQLDIVYGEKLDNPMPFEKGGRYTFGLIVRMFGGIGGGITHEGQTVVSVISQGI